MWTRVVSKRNQKPPLQIPFELPKKFQQVTQEALDQQNLTGRAQAKFKTTIAESIHRYKSYPTKIEYEPVANQMVKKWCFLKTWNGDMKWT